MTVTAGPDVLVGTWLDATVRDRPDAVAIEYGDARITYRELDATAASMARGLYARGVRRGDVVASLSENHPAPVALLFACARLGAALFPLNWRLAPAEIRVQLELVRARLLVVSPRWSSRRDDVVRAAVRDVVGPDDLLTGGPTRVTDTPDPDDPVLVIATSGSTGVPKAVALSHANCHWTNESLAAVVPIGPDDGVLQVLPQFHVGGWNVQPLLAWRRGARVVLEADFDAERALEIIDQGRVRSMMGVPTTYLLLAQSPRFASTDLGRLREVVVGGAVMPEHLAARWVERGVRVVQGYGLTEAAPNVCCLRPEEMADHAGSVGRPYPFVEVALYDPTSDSFVDGPGEGELCVRGPNVFRGYLHDPESTRAAFTGEWLRTGDVASRDAAGFYRVVGRIKEMYVSGGENVYPAEVERVLDAYPGVLDATVVPVPDDRWGEVGVAYLVLAPGASAGVDELRAHLRRELAAYKAPREFRVVESLPRTAVGKLDRAALASRARGETR